MSPSHCCRFSVLPRFSESLASGQKKTKSWVEATVSPRASTEGLPYELVWPPEMPELHPKRDTASYPERNHGPEPPVELLSTSQLLRS